MRNREWVRDVMASGDFLMISDLLKATPSEEAGARILYIEASNESLDVQGERVLAKALAESRDYYLRYGNFDLDHVTQLGPRRGIVDYARFEIGRPTDVQVDGRRTFVKGEVYQGDTPVAAAANDFWDSITKLSPPQRWYPSLGGAVMARDDTKRLITKVRWTNIGLSKTPVNQPVPSVSVIRFGVLAKSWGIDGLDVEMSKTLTAGYGTDSATLEGGGALRKQSLDRKVQSYWGFRDRVAGALRAKRLSMDAPSLCKHACDHLGLDSATAVGWPDRFLAEVAGSRSQKKG